MQPRSSASKSESFLSASSCSVRSLSPRATHPFLNSCSPRHSHGVPARGSTSPQQSPGSDSVFLTALKYPDITDRDRTTHRHSTRSLRATRRPATHAATRGTARRLTLAPAGAPTTAHPHAQRQRWISGNREVGTAALPSAMPVISVALKPHGRISRARNSQSSEPSFCHNHKGSPPARPAARGVVGHLWTRAPSAGRSGSR